MPVLLPIPGEVNRDCFVSVSDVTALLLEIFMPDSGSEDPARYDINGDGFVNITDVTRLLHILSVVE